jgi:ATP-dependent helicase HrpA
MGMKPQDRPAPADNVHQALLAGLLSHVGLRDADKRDYVGARGARWNVVPGSVLFKKTPRWVVAADLVETNRLWGRTIARIQPEWAERLADHLVVRNYAEPHWERKRAGVVATERVTLYGLPLVVDRKVDYGRIDPVTSRDLFLRRALVEGDWDTHHAFFEDNRRLLRDVAELEDRARRRDLVVDDEVVYDFYDARIPSDVVSGRHFDAWWKKTRHSEPGLLTMTMPMLLSEQAAGVSPGDFPDVWVQGDLRLALTYQFEPGASADGVTVHVPLPVLNRLSPEGFDWQVPGLRQELVVAVLKALPKNLRVQVGPAPDAARLALAGVEARTGPMAAVILDEIHRQRRVDGRPEDVDWSRVPDHLRITFRVFSGTKTLAEGKDLVALQKRLAPKAQQAVSSAAAAHERKGLTTWDVGTLEDAVTAGEVRGFPALVDEGTAVGLKVLGNKAAAVEAHHAGTRRLLLLNVPNPLKAVSQRLTNPQKLALARNPHGSVSALLDDVLLAAVDALMPSDPRSPEAFAALLASVRAELPAKVVDVVSAVEQVLVLSNDLQARLGAETRPPLAAAVEDMQAQLGALVRPGFVVDVGAARLGDLQRWLRGIAARLDKLPQNHLREQSVLARYRDVQDEWARLPESEGKREVRWMLEELRLSLFAQSVKTRGPISEKRVFKALDALH